MASAVLFQGFHGTATQIIDVVFGFLTICAGVVLLQLAKSSKDVPDSKVFSGDLDQIRTVAEVEEPEYEPRADTLRGGAGIVRAMSRVRTKRQADEAKRIHEERMEPIGENDHVEWDGLRRRKTVSSAGGGGGGSVIRRKTVHPPLGMSYFPDDVSEPDSEVHPGFFGRIGRKSNAGMGSQGTRRGISPVALENVQAPAGSSGEHIYGMPESLRHPTGADDEDTAYKPPSSSSNTHIQWTEQDMKAERERAASQGGSLAPPRPPPHGQAKRHFSFQNPFNRKSDAGEDTGRNRSVSRGAMSYSSQQGSTREYPSGDATTEEERLGLVLGDSSRSPAPFDERGEAESDEWQVTSGTSSSPEQVGASTGDLGRQRTRDPYMYDDNEDDDDFYDEPLQSPTREDGGKRGGSAFV